MISAIVAVIAGWLLAAKVRPTWLGVAGCIVAGIAVGAASVAVAVHSAVLPVDHARIPDAVFEGSIRFSAIALVIYAILRFVMRRANKPTTAQQPAPSDSMECPYCAELIKARAVVCKHCGRDLSASPAVAPQHAAPTSAGCEGVGVGDGAATLTREASMQSYGITLGPNLLNSYNREGYTPLMVAVFARDVAGVSDLLSRGADASMKDGTFGTSTALDMASLAQRRATSAEERATYESIIEILRSSSEF